MSNYKFNGYRRENGRVGIRNHVTRVCVGVPLWGPRDWRITGHPGGS